MCRPMCMIHENWHLQHIEIRVGKYIQFQFEEKYTYAQTCYTTKPK